MQEALRRELEDALAHGLEREDKDVVLLALHIGCGAFALGVRGSIEPSKPELDDG